MTYIRTSSRPRDRYRRLIVGICVIAGVLGATVQFFYPHFFPALAASLATPFWRFELAREGDSLRAPDAVLRENEQLKILLEEDLVRLATVSAIESENKELKAILGRTQSTQTEADGDSDSASDSASATARTTATGTPSMHASANQLSTIRADGKILAAVMERPPFSQYDLLVIDVGTGMGVKNGDRVYSTSGILVGRVSDALGKISKVMLYSSSGESLPVLIGESQVSATATGRGGGQYEARLPQGADISEGDFVISPSIWDRPFGVVTAVLKDPAQPFETVLFAPPVNVYQLRWVLIEKR